MPLMLIWAVPGVRLGITGYYLSRCQPSRYRAWPWMPTERPLDRRRNFKVIKGGKAALRETRCAG